MYQIYIFFQTQAYQIHLEILLKLELLWMN